MAWEAWRVFWVFLRLGLTSFGGPTAHLGYFHEEFVRRRSWLDESAYADLVALCQFLPGPASSQVGIAIGLSRASLPGALAAWLGFTLPSAALLVAFGLGMSGRLQAGWIHGLKVVAVAVVAQALVTMAKKLCPDRPRAAMALGSAFIVMLAGSVFSQLAVMGLAAVIGKIYLHPENLLAGTSMPCPLSRRLGASLLAIFVALLGFSPLVATLTGLPPLQLWDCFYRAGALVFGGGHVVLPLLQAQIVPPGWVSADVFMAGYGAAQGVPGPLFSFAAYLGSMAKIGPGGWWGAALCLVAAFSPAFLLITGILPFWEKVRVNAQASAAMKGVNAAVVGLLLAAFIDPVWTSAIHRPLDLALALIAFAALQFRKVPSWAVVALGALAGAVLGRS